MGKTSPHQDAHLLTIAKNTGLGIGGRLLFLLMRFCIALLVARAIGPEQYGLYVLSMSVITFLLAFSVLGIEPAMVKFVAQYKAQDDIPMLRGAVVFGCEVVMVSSIILGLVIFSSAEWVSEAIFHKTTLTPLLRIMALGVPFSSLMVILLSALQGVKLVKYKIFVQQIFMPSFRFTLIALALWLGLRVMGVAWAWVVTTVIGFILAIFFLMRRIGPLFSTRGIAERKRIISFSIPLLLSSLFYQNRNMVGILILGGFYPASQVGVYGVAMRAIPFLLIPLFGFNSIFSPIISDLFTKGKMGELERIYKTGAKWVISITLPVFTLIVFFSKEIVSVFGSGFAQSAEIITVLLIGQMANAATGSSALMLSMTGKPLYNLFNSVVLFVLSIVLTIFMIDRFGPIGAAYAYSSSIILVQLIQMGEVWHLYRIHPYTMEHIKPVLSCLFSFLIIRFVENSFPIASPLISIMVLVLIFLCSYGIFLLFAGLSPGDRMVLGKLLQNILRKGAAVTQ
ncbi:MAG: flippase [Candidatus Hodarchaeota archaeon]